MKFELKDILVIGGVVVSLTVAFTTLRADTEGLDKRVIKLEKLELNDLRGKVDRMSCKIAQLRKQVALQPQSDCPD